MASAIKLTQHETFVDITLDGKPFTTYHFAPGNDSQFARPYLFPVLATDGTLLTSDQVRTGGDHPHHRSFYVAHGEVNGANHWMILEAAKRPLQRHLAFASVKDDTIVEQLAWESADKSSILLKETRTLRFLTLDDNARAVDLTVALTPAGDVPVTLADTKEAGLCSIRVVKAISDSATLTNSEGKTGEADTWGKAAAWCDISGKVENKPYGVASLDHPKNPRHPTRWHVRQYGLMSANPFGLHDFDKSPKGTGDMKLEPGKTATFRYRVVFHTGDAKAAALPAKFAEFAKL